MRRAALASSLVLAAFSVAAQGLPIRRAPALPHADRECRIENRKWKHLEKRMPTDREFFALKRDWLPGRVSEREWRIATNLGCP